MQSSAPPNSHLVLIPAYNPGEVVIGTVRAVLQNGAPVWVVVDGSDDGSGEKLDALAESEPSLRVIRLARNQGKGAAVLRGAREALADGFTHMLCLDADGQHPAGSVGAFMRASRENPDHLILGRPVFDDCAPRARVHGRKISNFFANLVTAGGGIGDSLFGMRVYPLEPFVRVMDRTRWARRFDFDPEIAVRLCWDGLPTTNLDTPVRYLSAEEGGVSHFKYFRDNALLTWMYFRLLLEFFLRLPRLLARKRRRKREAALRDPDSKESLQQIRRTIVGRFRQPWHRSYANTKLRTDPLYEAIFREVLKNGNPFPILDIGCGMGLLAYYLRERGLTNRVLGCDYDPRKIKAARKLVERHQLDIEFRQADAREGIPDFQGHVVLLDILQFFDPDEQEAVLRSAAQSVPEDGLLLIRNCLADESWRFRVTRIGDRFAKLTRWMKDHATTYPTESRIRFILESEGLNGEFRPLWGRTPFNNWLAVYRRPLQRKASSDGSTQA